MGLVLAIAPFHLFSSFIPPFMTRQQREFRGTRFLLHITSSFTETDNWLDVNAGYLEASCLWRNCITGVLIDRES